LAILDSKENLFIKSEVSYFISCSLKYNSIAIKRLLIELFFSDVKYQYSVLNISLFKSSNELFISNNSLGHVSQYVEIIGFHIHMASIKIIGNHSKLLLNMKQSDLYRYL
jgi:hypothetical protein